MRCENCYGTLAEMLGAKDKQITELQAHVNHLREALRLSTNGLRTVSRWSISEETEKAITTQIIENENALSSSPTQSLLEHDNEVIEKCAKLIESGNFLTDSSAEARLSKAASKAMRTLKVTP